MFAGYHLCYLYKSNTMLKHTAVVRPSGWRRKASKERCFMAGLCHCVLCKDTDQFSVACLPADDGLMLSRSLSSIFTQPSTVHPASFNLLIASKALASLRAPMMIFQPPRPRYLLIPKPIPLLAPVINAVLFISINYFCFKYSLNIPY